MFTIEIEGQDPQSWDNIAGVDGMLLGQMYQTPAYQGVLGIVYPYDQNCITFINRTDEPLKLTLTFTPNDDDDPIPLFFQGNPSARILEDGRTHILKLCLAPRVSRMAAYTSEILSFPVTYRNLIDGTMPLLVLKSGMFGSAQFSRDVQIVNPETQEVVTYPNIPYDLKILSARSTPQDTSRTDTNYLAWMDFCQFFDSLLPVEATYLPVGKELPTTIAWNNTHFPVGDIWPSQVSVGDDGRIAIASYSAGDSLIPARNNLFSDFHPHSPSAQIRDSIRYCEIVPMPVPVDSSHVDMFTLLDLPSPARVTRLDDNMDGRFFLEHNENRNIQYSRQQHDVFRLSYSVNEGPIHDITLDCFTQNGGLFTTDRNQLIEMVMAAIPEFKNKQGSGWRYYYEPYSGQVQDENGVPTIFAYMELHDQDSYPGIPYRLVIDFIPASMRGISIDPSLDAVLEIFGGYRRAITVSRTLPSS